LTPSSVIVRQQRLLVACERQLRVHREDVPGRRDDPDHQERLKLEAAPFRPRDDRPDQLEDDHDESRAADGAVIVDREWFAVRRQDEGVCPVDEHDHGDGPGRPRWP
jgi:hypothetical protein